MLGPKLTPLSRPPLALAAHPLTIDMSLSLREFSLA